MAIFNVTNDAIDENLPPTVVGNITINLDYNESYVMTVADFTTGTTPVYSDPEGDAAETLKVVTLPTVGSLKLSLVDVEINDEILFSDILAGNLIYTADPSDTDGYTDSDMTFNIADEGSSTYGSITEGIITFIVAETNLPPDSIGDNEININWNEVYPYTAADFTTGTTPAYSDPEGDSAENLKILSLPSVGTLKYNGVNVIVNQIIPFTGIVSGNFKYHSDGTDTDGYSSTWNFAISDEGSGEYSS